MHKNKFARLSRLSVAFCLAISITAAGAALPSAGATKSQQSLAFLQNHFVSGKFIEGLTQGQPDYGFSLEGLLQLRALGASKANLTIADKYLLASPDVSGTLSDTSGYLFNAGKLRLGLAGKWAFVSAVLGTSNLATRRGIIGAMSSKIDGSGDVAADARANTYDRAWMVLALVANDRPRQAATLASNMAKHQLADGGFNDGFTLGSSSTDGTGITLQALGAALPQAATSEAKTIHEAISRAAAYLAANVKSDHFESYGDADVNGTAYAAMGLRAVGKSTLGTVQWLKGKLASDGGLTTPWSAGSGDIYATAQGLVAMQGRSYLDLLKPIKKG